MSSEQTCRSRRRLWTPAGPPLHFVYDCDPLQSNGLLPATANTIAATACGCPDGEYLLGGECVASPAADSCLAGGWSLSLADGACGAPVTLSGDTASDRCYLTGDDKPRSAPMFSGRTRKSRRRNWTRRGHPAFCLRLRPEQGDRAGSGNRQHHRRHCVRLPGRGASAGRGVRRQSGRRQLPGGGMELVSGRRRPAERR